MWYEGNPCNMHLMDLAGEVKAGVEASDMVAYRFNTIGCAPPPTGTSPAPRRPPRPL